MVDEDTYFRAMNKVDQGIKLLINQATTRSKLIQEMSPDGRWFREWLQFVVVQATGVIGICITRQRLPKMQYESR